MTRRMLMKASAGTSSWSPASSLVISSGKTSTREERNWPTLMSTPPISMARVRKLAAIRCKRADRVRSDRLRSPILGKSHSQAMSWSATVEKKRTMRRYRCEGLTQGSILQGSRFQVPRFQGSKVPGSKGIGTFEPRNAGTLKLWNRGTLEPWNPGTVELWNSGTVWPFLPSTPLDGLQERLSAVSSQGQLETLSRN